MTNPTHDVEIQGHVVFCRHCTCSACAPAREMASASEKQAGDPPSEPVRLTCRTPYESHNVSGYRVDFFHSEDGEDGEDGAIVVEVPAILGCITQGKDREEALANAAEAIAVSIEPDSPIAQLIAERDEVRSGVAHLTAGIASIGEAIGLVLAVQQKRAEERQTLEALVKEQEATIARLTAEQGTLIASALAGIEAVTKSNQALRTAAASIAGRDTFEGIFAVGERCCRGSRTALQRLDLRRGRGRAGHRRLHRSHEAGAQRKARGD